MALLVMTGRVTMLGLSRWAGKGGSYRTVQRFFSTVIPWAILLWVFFRHHGYCPDDVSLAAGDDVIVTKAGTHTHGLDRFCSSLYGKPVPGLAFFTLSLVRVQNRRSFPMRVEQVVRSDAEKAASKAKRQPRSPKRRAPSVGLDVRRAARTSPKPTGPARRSYGVLPAGSTPCCT